MTNFPIADPFCPASELSGELRSLTGDPGCGHRKLVELANNAQTAPPMERRGRYWGCRKSRIAELAMLLHRLRLLAEPPAAAPAAPVNRVERRHVTRGRRNPIATETKQAA